MAERSTPTGPLSPDPQPTNPTSPNTTDTKPKSTPTASVQALGSIVFVRSAFGWSPAIVVNNFGGTNAPGLLSLIVFLNEQFTSVSPVKYIPDAQQELGDTDAALLRNYPYQWWSSEPNDRDISEPKPKEEVAA